MAILNSNALREAIAVIPKWNVGEHGLQREMIFVDFKEALVFVNRVGAIAETAAHHPDIDIRYNRVLLTLMTHDQGGITRRDIDMAAILDRDLMD